ncbi:MAG: serine hydrolase [Winogradskyella sp.]|nr:serine hydrolase [Winogradskyella sp.]
MKLNSIVFTFLIFSQLTFSQNLEIPSDVKDHIKARVDSGFNPSIATAYIEGDNVVYYNYGKTEVNVGQPVDENTVYEIGSISKVFTTILLADEVLKGNMVLTDPISKYLPKTLNIPQRNAKVITLQDLATHTSGLPRMPDNFNPADPNNPFADYTVKQLYEFLSTYELTRDIGVQYEYSNLGMGLLGHILELHTGTPYENLILNRIAEPLGMNSTGIVFTTAMKEKLALGHNDQLEVVSNWDITTLAGAGAIRSTTSDMVKFIQANISTDDTALNKAMKLSHKIAFTDDNLNFKIGLGWHYATDNTITWHNGGTGGYRAFAGFLNNTNKGVVVLTNSISSADQIGLKLLDTPLNLELPKKKAFPDVVDLPSEILATYIGTYQLAPEFTLTITQNEKQLFAQATGQSKFEIFPSSENKFFLRVVEASITFSQNEEGKINGLTLHQGGMDMPAPKLD